jgi:hypothetical protein
MFTTGPALVTPRSSGQGICDEVGSRRLCVTLRESSCGPGVWFTGPEAFWRHCLLESGKFERSRNKRGALKSRVRLHCFVVRHIVIFRSAEHEEKQSSKCRASRLLSSSILSVSPNSCFVGSPAAIDSGRATTASFPNPDLANSKRRCSVRDQETLSNVPVHRHDRVPSLRKAVSPNSPWLAHSLLLASKSGHAEITTGFVHDPFNICRNALRADSTRHASSCALGSVLPCTSRTLGANPNSPVFVNHLHRAIASDVMSGSSSPSQSSSSFLCDGCR